MHNNPNSAQAAAREEIIRRLSESEATVFEAIEALDKASQIGARARKDGGVVYTPINIALEMCALANPRLEHSVLEPSCGRGVFIFALAMHHMGAGACPQDVHDALAKNLKACDLDPQAIADLQALWAAFWRGHGVDAPKPLETAHADSLFGPFSAQSFDLSIGNPPYVRFQNLPLGYRSKLQKSFPTCAKGNVDIFFAFVEQAVRQAETTCMIFPNSWMGTSSGASLRSLLGAKARKIIDFGSKLVFAPVRTYVCIALAKKTDRPAGEPLLVKFEEPSAPGSWLPINASDPRVGLGRWALSASPAPAATKTLGDIATLYSGIATLADSAYAITGSLIVGEMAEFDDPELGRLQVPLEWAPKKAKLTKLRSEADLLALSERIFSPYAGGRLIPFESIAKRSPNAAAFLEARRARFAERDKGKQEGYEEWHAYGRKQGLKPLPQGALCAVSIMSSEAIQCFKLDSRKAGSFLFTSGFILAPKPGSSAEDIMGALQKPSAWEWMLAHGKPWAGPPGKNYRSWGARLLLSLPIA